MQAIGKDKAMIAAILQIYLDVVMLITQQRTTPRCDCPTCRDY
jgi:hypothetical protein